MISASSLFSTVSDLSSFCSGTYKTVLQAGGEFHSGPGFVPQKENAALSFGFEK